MDKVYYYKDYSTKIDFPGLDKLFGIQAQLDMTNIPENMADCVEESRDYFLEKVNVRVKYAFYKIIELSGDEVAFSDIQNDIEGQCFDDKYVLKGTLLPNILKDCHSIMLYILTLNGYEEVVEECEDDMLLTFFADAWGSAYAESADTFFLDNLRKECGKKHIHMTISHNPGQHLFPLENQKVFFDLLKPDNLDVRLTDSFLMMPSKSVSGIVGISDIPQDLSKVSCDFCNMRTTCSTAYAQKSIVT